MKILFLATLYTHLANFHKPFMSMLQDKGYEVHAAASNSEGRRQEIEELGVLCWDVPFSRNPLSLKNISAVHALKKIISANSFDLVHVHTPVAGFFGRWLVKKTGRRVIYTAHGFHFFEGAPWINRLAYYTAERAAARWTDALIVINSEDYQAGREMGFVPGESLFLVHGVGVDTGVFYKEESYPAAGEKPCARKIVISCVAEFSPVKNHGFLLKAWRILAERYDNIELIFVGDGRLRYEIEKFIKTEEIPRVRILGYRSDVANILRRTDIVTLVSKREGLPKCLMEAMACGKPVVASDIRGNRDLINDGETGFLVPLNSVEGLVNALEKLIKDEKLRLRMGRTAVKRIQAYSVEKVLKEMENIYGKFLSK